MKFFDYDLSEHGWTLLQRHVQEIEALFGERKLPSPFIQRVLEDKLHSAFVWATDEDLVYLRDLVRFISWVVPYYLLMNGPDNTVNVLAFCNPESLTRFRVDAEGYVFEICTTTGEETALV